MRHLNVLERTVGKKGYPKYGTEEMEFGLFFLVRSMTSWQVGFVDQTKSAICREVLKSYIQHDFEDVYEKIPS